MIPPIIDPLNVIGGKSEDKVKKIIYFLVGGFFKNDTCFTTSNSANQ
jgi:hypothetical protein